MRVPIACAACALDALVKCWLVQGRSMEQPNLTRGGTHSELINEPNSLYSALVALQQAAQLLRFGLCGALCGLGAGGVKTREIELAMMLLNAECALPGSSR